MAAYPTQAQRYGSSKETSYGTQIDQMVSGKPRFRTLYSQERTMFRLQHDCTTAQKDAILSHYATHATVSFSLTYQADGASYTVRYANKPQVQAVAGNYDWEVETTLVTV